MEVTTEEKVTSTVETPAEAPQAAETGAVPLVEVAQPTAAQEAGLEKQAAGQKKVVRTLTVGQQLKGTIKRVADFGAFVDIGVGRDGLVHISELSWNRVNKVSDVVSEGQEVDVWVKELDRERNRISLTMRKPPDVDIATLQPDMVIGGTVSRIVPYGAFVDIGTGREALLHVREMANGYVKNPADIVSIGGKLQAKIIKIDPKTKQVDLSIKELIARAEPEKTTSAKEEPKEADKEEVLPTAMEVALKEAFDMEGKEPRWVTRRRQERRKKDAKRHDQDDILTRTLRLHKKWDGEE